MPTRNAICYSMTTYPICDSRRSFAPLQKSRRNLCSYMWTEALSAMLSIPRKTYLVKCENSLNLTLPTIMLPNTSSSSDDITTRPWVREIITSSSNDIKKKKSWSIYLPLPGKLSCLFYWGCERQTYKNKRERLANKETKEKAAIGSVPLVWCWLIMKCEATSIQHGTNFRPAENL